MPQDDKYKKVDMPQKPSNPMPEPKKPSDYINQPPSLPKPPQRGMPTESPYTEGKPIRKRLPKKMNKKSSFDEPFTPEGNKLL